MAGNKLLSLKEMIEQIGEDESRQELSIFYCPLNKDVENFILTLTPSSKRMA